MTKIQTTSVWGVVKEKNTPEQTVYGQRNSPHTGGTMQNEEDELIGILGQPTPTRLTGGQPSQTGSFQPLEDTTLETLNGTAPASVDRNDIPVGQPPARIPAVPGSSGSSEVFRTETGTYPMPRPNNDLPPDHYSKTLDDGTVVTCEVDDYHMSLKWVKKNEV